MVSNSLKRCATYIIVMKNRITFECNREDRTFINIYLHQTFFSPRRDCIYIILKNYLVILITDISMQKVSVNQKKGKKKETMTKSMLVHYDIIYYYEKTVVNLFCMIQRNKCVKSFVKYEICHYVIYIYICPNFSSIRKKCSMH